MLAFSFLMPNLDMFGSFLLLGMRISGYLNNHPLYISFDQPFRVLMLKLSPMRILSYKIFSTIWYVDKEICRIQSTKQLKPWIIDEKTCNYSISNWKKNKEHISLKFWTMTYIESQETRWIKHKYAENIDDLCITKLVLIDPTTKYVNQYPWHGSNSLNFYITW